MTTLGDIHDAEFELEQAKEAWLRERGWKRSCETPGSYWLWLKTMRGKEWMGGTDLAISMQRGAYGYGWEADPEGEESEEPRNG